MDQSKLKQKAIDLLSASGDDPRWGRKSFLRKVISILDAGADLSWPTYDGTTLFMLVCKLGLLDWIQKGIDDGIDINHNNNFGWSPLMWTTIEGNENAALLLLKLGADYKNRYADGFTFMMAAAHEGMAEALKVVVADETLNINAVDDRGKTAFSWCLQKNPMVIPSNKASAKIRSTFINSQRSCMDVLVKSGADITIKDKNGRSAFYHALLNSNTEAADYLLLKGADVNEKDNQGRTIFSELFFLNRKPGFIDILERSASFLLKHKCDIDTLDFEGKTAREFYSGGNEYLFQKMIDSLKTRETQV